MKTSTKLLVARTVATIVTLIAMTLSMFGHTDTDRIVHNVFVCTGFILTAIEDAAYELALEIEKKDDLLKEKA